MLQPLQMWRCKLQGELAGIAALQWAAAAGMQRGPGPPASVADIPCLRGSCRQQPKFPAYGFPAPSVATLCPAEVDVRAQGATGDGSTDDTGEPSLGCAGAVAGPEGAVHLLRVPGQPRPGTTEARSTGPCPRPPRTAGRLSARPERWLQGPSAAPAPPCPPSTSLRAPTASPPT